MAEQQNSRPRKVLLSVDGSKNSELAFDYYFEFMWHESDEVEILHVPEGLTKHEIPPDGASPEDEYKKFVSGEEKTVSELTAKYDAKAKKAGIVEPLKWVIRCGKAGEVICDCVAEDGPDFVLMGSRGMGLIRRTIMGSVSDYVLHHSCAPVIIVPKH